MTMMVAGGWSSLPRTSKVYDSNGQWLVIATSKCNLRGVNSIVWQHPLQGPIRCTIKFLLFIMIVIATSISIHPLLLTSSLLSTLNGGGNSWWLCSCHHSCHLLSATRSFLMAMADGGCLLPAHPSTSMHTTLVCSYSPLLAHCH